MTSQQILQADVLDILFEHRNKAYGAYQLRKSYDAYLLQAMTIGVGTVLFFVFLIRPSESVEEAATPAGAVEVRDFHLPPQPKQPIPPKKTEAQPVKQKAFTPNIVITQKDVLTTLPPQDELEHAAVSSVTTDGREMSTLAPPTRQDVARENVQKETPEPVKEPVPDQQPQFPGGVKAWMAFLQTNLRMPEELATGEKRTALIRFYVAEDGTVTNFVVVQSAGSSFDNEVMRVLKKMPKWTPALQSGRPVAVSFTQPVTFVGVEE